MYSEQDSCNPERVTSCSALKGLMTGVLFRNSRLSACNENQFLVRRLIDSWCTLCRVRSHECFVSVSTKDGGKSTYMGLLNVEEPDGGVNDLDRINSGNNRNMAGLRGRISVHIWAIHVSPLIHDNIQFMGYRYHFYIL
jgi:hypothetical protein